MLKGRAVGGPRNNVVIDAPAHWDGRIKEPSSNAMIPGHYTWEVVNSTATWLWISEERKPPRHWGWRRYG